MSTSSSQHQQQKIGITYESIILILLPAAQSIPLIFHQEAQAIPSSQKLFIFFSFCVAGANFCAQVIFSFLKNQERVIKFRQIIRILVWILSVINIVENQIIFFEEPSTTGQTLLLSYSVMGIYLIGVIQLISIHDENLKRALICLNILYVSLRISINCLDPILGVFSALLCLIMVRFSVLFNKAMHSKPEKAAKSELENYLMKILLADVEEGLIILGNNRSVYYSNQKSQELLKCPPEDLITRLEQIQCFDSLSQEIQLEIREKAIDFFQEKESGQGRYKSMPFSLGNLSKEDVILGSRSNLLDQVEDCKNDRFISVVNKSKLFADPGEKKQKVKTVSHAAMTMSRFKLPQKKEKNVFKSKTRLSNIKTTILPSKTNVESQHDDLISIEENGSEIKESGSKFIYQNSENILKQIPSNLKNLFHIMKIKSISDISSKDADNYINFPRKGSGCYGYDCHGYLTNEENHIQMLDVRLQPLYMKDQPFLVVRIKDKIETEYCKWLKETEKERNDILSSVSHELRTPLNCIITMLDMVQEHIPEDLVVDYIHPAAHSAKLLLSLVNDILDLSQSRAKTLKLVYSHFDLKEHLESVLKLMDTQARGKELTLRLEYDEKAPRKIYSEPNRLRQIIINLIGNAIKFTLKGTIVLRVEYLETKIYEISINDTGVGIKPENMNKLFRQFSKMNDTSHINHQGVGLGLSISNMLVKMLSPNGKGINVNSIYGQGTTFSFEIESKPNMDFSERLEFNLSSEENEDRNVFENINELKTQNDSAQNQKNKVFNKRKTSTYAARTSIFSKNYSLSNLGIEKENILGSLLQPTSSKNDIIAASQKTVKDSRISLNIQIPLANVSSNNKIDQNLYLHKTFRTLQTFEDPFFSIDRRSSARSKSLIEKEDFVIIKERKDMIIRAIAKKINSTSALPCMLVVDDNAFNIIALKSIFEGMNLKIDSATNGDLAIKKLLERKNTEENYKVIFMDCYMPLKNGFEVTSEIRGLQREKMVPQIPIIAVTASNSPRDIEKCYEVGMDDCLMKPINSDILKDLIIKHLGTIK